VKGSRVGRVWGNAGEMREDGSGKCVKKRGKDRGEDDGECIERVLKF
jgi:hypothetical protein